MTGQFASDDPSREGDAPRIRQMLLELAEACRADGSSAEARDGVAILDQLFTPALCRRLGIYRLPADFVLSVVIPVYNEAATIEAVLHRVREAGVPCQMIVVDDGSTDGTREVLDRWRDEPDVTLLSHATNLGKGAALRTGFAHTHGDAVIVQDADLEYDPKDYRLLIQPIVEDRADVVYGSRFSARDRPVSPFWHQTGNRLITLLSNLMSNLKLTDVETCYKVFRRGVLERITPTLKERGFGIELEITAKLAKLRDIRMYERPISYAARRYDTGKKIGWRDAVWALWCIMRY